MHNTFAHWQPIYAEAGIALLPAVDKRPIVRNGGSFTTKASAQLVARHGGAQRVGFWCGRTSRITVIDIDSPDPKVLDLVLRRFGASPIIARTPSGGHHVWYRHSGETRCTRLEGLPIDVLGNGFVMAPPSRTERGDYAFIEGSLAAVHQLPAIAASAWGNAALPRPVPRRQGLAALLVPPATCRETVPEGGRNIALFCNCLREASTCEHLSELVARAAVFNRREFLSPLPETEVARTAASAWKYHSEGRNWVGKGQFAPLPYSAIDSLLADAPDALLLLTRLVRHHLGLRDTFVVANAMRTTMSRPPWSAKRLARAREVLIRTGMLIPAGRSGRLATYRFAPDTPLTPKENSVISIGSHSDDPAPF